MNINFQNNTYYKQLMLVCDGEKYILNKNETLHIVTDSNQFNLKVFVSDKNRVILNWLFILLDGFIDGDSVVNALQCNTEFEVNFPDYCVCETIVIRGLDVRDTEQCIYNGVYLYNNSMIMTRCGDTIKEWKKHKRKAMFYHIVVTSALPVVLLTLGLFFARGDVWAFVVAILNLAVFSIPSWIRASRLKRFYSDENAHALLSFKEMELIQNNGNPVIHEPTDFIGKTVFRVLDKFFGENKNKK